MTNWYQHWNLQNSNRIINFQLLERDESCCAFCFLVFYCPRITECLILFRFFFSSVLMQSFCLGCLLRVCCRVLCILKAIRDGHCKLAQAVSAVSLRCILVPIQINLKQGQFNYSCCTVISFSVTMFQAACPDVSSYLFFTRFWDTRWICELCRGCTLGYKLCLIVYFVVRMSTICITAFS